MHDKQDQADRMIQAGASAYCTKDGETSALLAAICGGERLTEKYPLKSNGGSFQGVKITEAIVKVSHVF